MNTHEINRIRALIALADAITGAQVILTSAHIAARTEKGYTSAADALVSLRKDEFSKVRSAFSAAVAAVNDMDEDTRATFHTQVWKK